jgi:hypothetical protein
MYQCMVTRVIARWATRRLSAVRVIFFIAGRILTVKPDTGLGPTLQLDELFENELLRSNVPFDDFSFLGELVNDTEPLSHDGSIDRHADPTDPDALADSAPIPASKPTPISPYSQQDDKLSGIDSLELGHGPDISEKFIPPGLFVGLVDSQSGFLGTCRALITW